MRSYLQLGQSVLLLFAVLLWLAGCGPSGSTPSRSAAGGGTAEEDLGQLIGDYMPPIDDERLEIAPPKGWSFSRAGRDYLVGFHPADASLNDLPRILVSVEPSPFLDVDQLQQSNADKVVQAIQATLSSDQVKSPPTAVTLGDQTWIEHVGLGKTRGTLVARQVLQTVVEGRLYVVRLEVFDRHFANQRRAGYAVAASAKFGSVATGTEPALPALDLDLPIDEDSDDDSP